MTSELCARFRPSPMFEPDTSEVVPLPFIAYRLRVFTMRDYEQVIDLWLRAGITVGPSDSREGILHTLQHDAGLFLVADDGERVVGTVMGTYDGRSGWAHHVAVDPQLQGMGVGAVLMRELENRLLERGCVKLNLTVARANVRAQEFYERLGFGPYDGIFMQKCL